jgi:transglutaminase-like putative cysteine protease
MLYRVDVNNSNAGTLFIAGIPEFINVEGPSLLITADDSFRAFVAPGEPLGYEVSALNGAPLPYPLPDRSRYTKPPLKLDPRIAALGHDWAGIGTDLERATRIQDRLHREFTYSLDAGIQPGSKNALADFLFVTRRGYCEYFASAMAVLLRTQDIPARVATGFQSGYYNDVSGEWVMRASDAHAWVEGWIEGRGWVTFDPTPPGSGHVAGGWLGRIDMYLDAADTAWQQWVVAYNPGQQVALAFAFRNKLRSLGRGGSGFGWPIALLSNTWVWGSWLLAAVALAAAFRIFGPRLWRQWKARKRIRRIRCGEGTASDARMLYEQMLESMARRGFQKPAWFTPMEFARTLPPGERERIGEFTAAYNEVRFGGDHPAGAARLTQMLKSMEGPQLAGK